MRSLPHVTRLDALRIQIPFRISFGHALARRIMTDNVVVRIALSDGTTGFGEAIPRHYLTGESAADVVDTLARWIASSLFRQPLACFDDAVRVLRALAASCRGRRGRAALVAVEGALLDAMGKVFACSARDALAEAPSRAFRYRGSVETTIDYEIATEQLEHVTEVLAQRPSLEVKVKVGLPDDDERIARLRALLPSAEIRVDANGKWTEPQALEVGARLRRLGIRVFEQPLSPTDLRASRRFRKELDAIVIADESVCTDSDVVRLADAEACDIVNVRTGKCGGLMESMRLCEAARRAGFGVQFSGMIGETGISEAANRHLVARLGELAYCDGGSQRDRFVDGIDTVVEDLRVAPGQSLLPPHEPGLGVSIDESTLERFCVQRTNWMVEPAERASHPIWRLQQ